MATNEKSEFDDAAGRTWSLAMSYADSARVKAKTKLDLRDAPRMAETWAKLLYGDELALDVLWLLIERTAEEKSVTREDFSGAMNGERLESALNALRVLIVREAGTTKRAMVERAIDELSAAYRRAIAEATEKLDELLTNAYDAASSPSSSAET